MQEMKKLGVSQAPPRLLFPFLQGSSNLESLGFPLCEPLWAESRGHGTWLQNLTQYLVFKYPANGARLSKTALGRQSLALIRVVARVLQRNKRI